MPVGSGKKKAGGQKAKQKKQQAQDKKTKKAAGKDQELSDKTFGMKNKKGTKGQKFVQQTTMALKGGEIRAAKKKEADRKSKKELKKQEEAAAQALFGSMEKTVRDKDGKKLTRNQIAAKKKAEEDKKLELQRKQDEWDTLTLEEKIEHKRAALDTTKCTPITPENFAVWKAAKRARREAAEEAKADLIRKKMRGKNKNIGKVSGRELFKIDASLFKDDAASFDNSEILAMSEPEESADEEEDKEDRGFLDSDSDMDTDDEDDAPKKDSSAEPPAAPTVDEVANVTEDLYLDDDGLDGLDDLDDLDDLEDE